ncbi:MAG: Ig-like domain-containing protein, partial [Anaerolineales bacterium]
MYRYLKGLLFTLLALCSSVALVSAEPVAQTDGIPPRVVEITPPAGAELGLDDPITLFFDQAMDQSSVDEALTLARAAVAEGEAILPAVTFATEWDDAQTLVISPEGDWPRDAALDVRVSAEAESADGVSLDEAFAARLNVVGFLEVAEVLPRPGATEIGVDSLITVIFNRPVVPLATLGDMEDFPNPLNISPDLPGEGEWLNTSIYVFTPENGLAGGTEHTVIVQAGLESIGGGVLAVPYEWGFSTQAPIVVEASPEPVANNVPLDADLSITFSQPMDRATTEAAISLFELAGLGVADYIQPIGPPLALGFEWEDDNRRVVITPDERLKLGTAYELLIDIEVARSASGARLAEQWGTAFSTVPAPRITRSNPEDGVNDANPFGGVQIYFNAPIDPDTLEGKFTIEPEPFREFETFYYDYDNRYSLDFDIQPSTDYTITIAPGIEDPYGNRIEEETVIRFSTRPYDPDINLNVPDFVGLYSAYNETTRVFVTHRNVSRLDAALYTIDAEQVTQLMSGFDTRDGYSPSDEELLRRWSVDVRSPENIRRYDLLRLSESGPDGIGNIQCLGAPPPRLQVGDRGVVVPDDPAPLRVRAEPNLQSQILTEIPPETVFDVIGGPICADGFIWWNITVEGQDVAGWSAEGTPDDYFMGLEQRFGTDPEVLDAADFPALDPGFYYLTVQGEETAAREHDPLQHVALVANANIVFKFSTDSALAWVTDLQTGEPLADVPVEFYDAEFGLLGRLNTNADGVAVLEIPEMDSLYNSLFAAVQSEDVFAFASARWDRGLAPWEFELPSEYEPRERTVYLYSDRPIYRPGQPVYFRGMIRNQDDVEFTVPDNLQSVFVVVYNPEDAIVYEGNLPLTPFGTFADSFTLDEGAALGFYRLAVELTPGEWRDTFSLGFNVAEFTAPEFQVNVTPDQDEVIQGEEINVLVEADYFFGGAVSDSRVEWSVLSAPYAFSPEGFRRYSFTDFDVDAGPGARGGAFGEQIASGEATTDAEGNYMITLPADLGTSNQSQRYTIEARVIDETDQLVAGRAEVIVHQGAYYTGLRPESYIGNAEQETAILVQTLDTQGEPAPDREIEYEIVERRWSSVQEEDELGRTVWTWAVEEIPLQDGIGTLTTDADGTGRITFVPPTAGTYKVYARGEDADGNTVQSAAFTWISGREYVAWRQQNSNRFDLIADADSYEVGDTAEILIASPFQGETTALVTVERGDILQQAVITLESNSQVYELPITPGHAPNIFVSVVIVQGVDEDHPYAQFRMGLTMLEVDTERLTMNIEVTPNLAPDEFAGPGDEVTYTVRTTDWQGEPVSAEVGLSVTDLSVLSIAPPNSSTLLDHFYATRGISVRTSASLSVSVDRLTQTIIDTIKGGGGGGDESGIFDIREEFVDTPGWEPTLVTDENGEAEYTLTLPDNLTTWRLDARAITRGDADAPMLVGQTTTDLLSTKPLLVRPLTPRFFVVGDVAELGAVVNNNTGEAQSVEVSIQGTGFEPLAGVNLTQTVDIPPGGRERVNWRVRILESQAVDLTFFADGNDGQFTDATKPTAAPFDDDLLPVYRYSAPETVGTAGVMPESGSRGEIVVLPPSLDTSRGELTVRVDRSLASAATQTLRALDYRSDINYSTAGIVSRFLPNVYTVQAFNELGIQN